MTEPTLKVYPSPHDIKMEKMGFRRFDVIADAHRKSPHEIKVSLHNNEIILGDFYDLKNTLKYKLHQAEDEYENIKKIYGERYLPGNHERDPYKNTFYEDGNVLFHHGHRIFWSKEKVEKDAKKPRGCGYMRWIGLSIIAPFRRMRLIQIGVRKKHLERVYQLAKKHKCDTVVCGHAHPRKIIDKTYKGIRLVVVPRGRSVIYV